MKSFLFLLIFVCTGTYALADVDVVVRGKEAQLYDGPNGRPIGKLAIGRKLKAEDQPVNGYRQLRTKSGRSVWVKDEDIEQVGTLESDLETEENDESFNRITWDIGFSTGSSGGTSYSEANLGVNYFFLKWLAWRNAGFGRFIQPENIYGLDSGARLFWTMGGGSASLTLFGGPGYRFVTKGDHVPFAEAGLITHLGGFTIGGGMKSFFTQVVRAGAETDTQYFLILSGGGAL